MVKLFDVLQINGLTKNMNAYVSEQNINSLLTVEQQVWANLHKCVIANKVINLESPDKQPKHGYLLAS